MAPEMISLRGGRAYDKKVDIWAVGVILYEMATKRLPVRPCQSLTLSSRKMGGACLLGELQSFDDVV